jgi:hypothetical protein
MQLAQRPGIDQAREANGGGPFASSRRRLRNDRQSDAIADHPAHGVETAEAHAQFEGFSGLKSALTEMLLKRICRGETDKLFVEQRSKGEAALIRDGMTARRHQNKTIGGERVRFQIAEIDNVRDDADVDKPSGHEPDDIVA